MNPTNESIGRYTKRPVTVEAVQLTWQTWDAVCSFLGDVISERNHGRYGEASDQCGEVAPYINLTIPTLEGDMVAQHGDWIIKGIKGEFYPCKPDIFEATYARELDRQAPGGVSGEVLRLSEREHEWVEYAIDHMLDDSEPEDQTCANVLRKMLDRCAVITAPQPHAQEQGDWLWGKLMDFCRNRRVPPAEYNDLFAIVSELRTRAAGAEDAREVDGYLIRRDGSIWRDGKQVMPYSRGNGYLSVSIWRNGVRSDEPVHRFVAKAWCEQISPEQNQVNHRDGNRQNNHVGNLEWCTAKENSIHAHRVLFSQCRPIIGTEIATGKEIHFNSLAETKDHGFKPANIDKCLKGIRRHHGGYTWQDAAIASQAQEGEK